MLVLATGRLLQNWPTSFLEICRRHSVRGSDLRSGQPRGTLPYWLECMVAEHIDAPHHLTGQEELIEASVYLFGCGIYPSRQRLAEIVGMHRNSLDTPAYIAIMRRVEERLEGQLPFLAPLQDPPATSG
ncbi:MAG: hypothetical protein WD081_01900 [Gammaproteobacteria bacterium]